MNRIALIVLVILIGSGSLYCGVILLDVYKTGEVRLVPAPEFGKNTDWEELLYHKAHYPCVGPDGSLFLANCRESRINKFSPDGKLIKTFGQKGLGPGDMTGPHDMTILDERYLVVPEELVYRRVSIFDLDGNFIKLIKTDYSVHACCALKNNKIALYSELEIPRENRTDCTAKFYIIDIKNGSEKLVYTRNLDIVKTTITRRGRKVQYAEEVFMHSTKDGNLLLGFNNNHDVLIFSSDGKQIRTFHLKLTRQKITSELKHRIYNIKLKRALENPHHPKKRLVEYKKSLIRNKNKILSEFGDFFPYYYDLIVDSDNNILVLKNRYIDEPDWKWTPVYQVYSKLGELKCEFALDFGEFDVRPHFHKCFFNRFLYGIFEKEFGQREVLLRLEKMTLNPKRRNNK